MPPVESNVATSSVAKVAKTIGIAQLPGKTEILGEFRYPLLVIGTVFAGWHR